MRLFESRPLINFLNHTKIIKFNLKCINLMALIENLILTISTHLNLRIHVHIFLYNKRQGINLLNNYKSCIGKWQLGNKRHKYMLFFLFRPFPILCHFNNVQDNLPMVLSKKRKKIIYQWFIQKEEEEEEEDDDLPMLIYIDTRFKMSISSINKNIESLKYKNFDGNININKNS